jgi:regulator of protease activity HflC (stomatin/prohibitin superfamily)
MIQNKLKILASVVTFVVIVIVMFESIVVVAAGHRGVVLYVGAVENRAIQVVANQTVVQAQATARANVVKASGESQAIKVITEQLKQSPQYLQWLSLNRWNGQMPYAFGSGAFPFFQLPVTTIAQNQTQR